MRTRAAGAAYLQFSNPPDGRFVAQYQLMGLMEGLVMPSFLKDHFQLTDSRRCMTRSARSAAIFWWASTSRNCRRPIAAMIGNSTLGLFHSVANGEFGFYYSLTRVADRNLPANTFLSPFPRCAAA